MKMSYGKRESLNVCFVLLIFSFCLSAKMSTTQAETASKTTTAPTATTATTAPAPAAVTDTTVQQQQKQQQRETTTVATSTLGPGIDEPPPTFVGESPAVDTAAENENWWRHTVFYQIYPRSFMDSNGDGVGDLNGIILKLPYLQETGITAIWLSPIYESPMIDFGYDISNFTAVQPEYGTMEDFEHLIAEAKRLGIKVILDFVPNHTSDQHDWFLRSAARESGYEDFYIWSDGKEGADGVRLPPNNWVSVFSGSSWTWNEQRQQFYYHQFTKEQPDLNYRNSKVVAAIDDVMKFWLEKGIDGFRIDAVNHIYESPKLSNEPLSGMTDDKDSYDYLDHIYTANLPETHDILMHWRSILDKFTAAHGGPTRIMMTEAYADIKTLMSYYEGVDGKPCCHFPFNFLFITDLNEKSDARDFVFIIYKWLTYMPKGHVANWVLGNHDKPRVASRFPPDMVDAMNMLLMMLPGVAITYNGEEIGMQDFRDLSWEDTVDPPACNVGPERYKAVSRDPVRTPFQWNANKNAGFSTANKTWLPVHPNYKILNLEDQMKKPKSHYAVYKALLAIRKFHATHKGRLHAEVLNNEVFAFERDLRDHSNIITVINIGPKQQTVNITEAFNVKSTLTVLVADSRSSHEKGQTISPAALQLIPHGGIVCMID